MLDEGDAALEHGNFKEAIAKYRDAYFSLDRPQRGSYLGSLPIRSVMQAYAQYLPQEQDPEKRRRALRSQRELLEDFLDEVSSREGAPAEVGQDVLAELEALHAALDEELEDGRTEAPEQTGSEQHGSEDPTDGSLVRAGREGRQADPLSEEVTPTAVEDEEPRKGPADQSPAPRPRRDWIGLGLVIGGSAALATGVGVSVGWWTIPKQAKAYVEEDGGPYSDALKAEYLHAQRDRARNYLVASSVVAGIGLATAIGGAIRLASHRHADRVTVMRIMPLLGPDARGVVVHRRF